MMFVAYQEHDDQFVLDYDGFSSRLTIDPETGHSRFSPMPPQEVLDKFYNGIFTRSESAPTPEAEFRQDVIAEFKDLCDHLLDIGAIGSNQISYHDVGCGFGATVWAMQKLGAKATGNEVNRDWVDRANPHCHGGLSAKPLDEALDALGYKIDLFFCSHVLEHVPDPLWHLKQMAAHMSDCGVAWLAVPNANNFRAVMGGRRADRFFEFPMHLNYFTPKSLFSMIREAGLEPADGSTALVPPYEVDDRGRWPMDVLLGLPSHFAIDQDAWTEAQCKNWLGGNLIMLAAKPGHKSIRRRPDLEAVIEQTFQFGKMMEAARAEVSGAQQGRLTAQQYEISDLRDRLSAVYGSHSWRITAPLRSLSAIATKLAKRVRKTGQTQAT